MATPPRSRRRRLRPHLRSRVGLYSAELGRDVYLGTRQLLEQQGARSPHARATRCAKVAVSSALLGMRERDLAERLGVTERTIANDRRIIDEALAEGALVA